MNELKHLGLSEKEALVYLASLELGPATVQDLSHKAKVNRATTYVMIEALSARGLLSTFVRGKKRFYAPENPERLVSILRFQKQELEEKEKEFSKTLPLLLALYNAEGAKPQIRYLEGPEGLETLRQTFEKLKGEFVQILNVDDALTAREFETGRTRHVSVLKQEKVPFRVLAVGEKINLEDIPDVGEGKMKMIPFSEFPLHGEITVRGNHVLLFSYRSTILAVVIVSKEIADSVRALFDLAWKGAQEYPTRKSE